MAKTRRMRKGAGIGRVLAKGVQKFSQSVIPDKWAPGYGVDPNDPENWTYEQQLDALKQLKGRFNEVSDVLREGGRSSASGGDIVTHLLTIRNQIKLYHWQTKQFARHKATDDLTAALDTNIDAFVESYMGRYGRPSVSGSIKLHNFSESAAKAFVAKETKYLETELPRKIGKNDTDLLNLRDTILGDLTKVSYLFTLA